jgi:hypothetical protein
MISVQYFCAGTEVNHGSNGLERMHTFEVGIFREKKKKGG